MKETGILQSSVIVNAVKKAVIVEALEDFKKEIDKLDEIVEEKKKKLLEDIPYKAAKAFNRVISEHSSYDLKKRIIIEIDN